MAKSRIASSPPSHRGPHTRSRRAPSRSSNIRRDARLRFPPGSGDAALGQTLDAVVRQLKLAEPEPPEPIAAQRRRRGTLRGSTLASVSLVRIDGVLRWAYHRSPRAVGLRRTRREGRLVGADVVYSYGFREVPPNQIVARLEDLDRKLTPNQGLRRWNAGTFSAVQGPVKTPRLLLVVHGSFSKSEVVFQELTSSPDGLRFLNKAQEHYQQVLAFDHPTLSVSPMLNALDLEKALAGYAGTVDVVCHSRGGLVTAWWLRMGLRKVGKVVFVGTPLEGTSLASPARLKQSLDTIANIADAAQKMAALGGYFVPPAAPLLGVAAGLMQVLGGVLSIGAQSSLLDAGVAVVVGLAAQSRVGNNQELIRLHQQTWPSTPTCFAVRSDFEPGNPNDPSWQFWKKLRRPLVGLANKSVDHIFDGPNDLVVDAVSMTRLIGADIPRSRVQDFGTNTRVHHCNYFAQPETAAFLSKTLLS
jgi:pimeloyl-ACP methyl ester carboxylesterase